jgi:transcriptional regulator with XRE-family HTH domain
MNGVRQAKARPDRPDLGASLKRIRGARNLTLSGLASLTGLPQSTLSKVENGQMSLNYGKLARLAEVLEVDVRELFMTESEAAMQGGKLARRIIDRAKSPEIVFQHYRFRYLTTELRNRLMLPILFELDTPQVPDEEIEMMDIVGQRFAYVLEGPVDFLCKHYETVTLDTGDAIYIDSAMPHAFAARGGRKARVISVLASSIPDYLELARQAASQGSRDASNAFRRRRRARLKMESD